MYNISLSLSIYIYIYIYDSQPDQSGIRHAVQPQTLRQGVVAVAISANDLSLGHGNCSDNMI